MRALHAVGSGFAGRYAWPLWLVLAVIGGVTALTNLHQAQYLAATTKAASTANLAQRAHDLVITESMLMHAMIAEPDAGDHGDLRSIDPQIRTVVRDLEAADAEHTAAMSHVFRDVRALQSQILQFLKASESGAASAELLVVEEQTEPLFGQIQASLQAEVDTHGGMAADLTERATVEARVYQVLSGAAFALGLLVIGWLARRHNRGLALLASRDHLTGLANRATFEARGEAALLAGERDGDRPTVLLLDLNGFKAVNDTHGHHVGDLLLVEVADRLRSCVAPGDTVARLGGDEFAVLLVGSGAEAGELCARRIGRALERPVALDGVEIDVEASIGIATATAGETLDALTQHADAAMYASKRDRIGHVRHRPEDESRAWAPADTAVTAAAASSQ